MIESMQETLRVQSCIRKYPWLIQMVKSRLFHEMCDEHTKQTRSYFCCDCTVPPLCRLCFEKSDHISHFTIQSYRCSKKSALEKEVISKYLDISKIQTYRINGKSIIYINRQRYDSDNHRTRNNVTRKCQVCEWELDAASSNLVCSVECKLKNTLGSQLDDLMENSEDVEEPVVKPQKRHRRKRTPPPRSPNHWVRIVNGPMFTRGYAIEPP